MVTLFRFGVQELVSVLLGTSAASPVDLITGLVANLLSHLLLMVNELHPLLPSSLLNLTFQSRVVVVLDMVVSASGKVLGNL